MQSVAEDGRLEPAVIDAISRMELMHWWFVARRHILLDLIAQLLPAGQERLVIDVGCGTGANTAAIDKLYRCVGIDISAHAITLARARFPETRFIRGCAPHDLGKLAEQASLFLLADVLEHIRDDVGMISELLAVAASGSYIVLTVPADPRLWSPHDDRHQHYRRYTEDQLEQLWHGLPVSTLLLSRFNSRLYPLIRLTRVATRYGGTTGGEEGTDLSLRFALANRIFTWVFAGEIVRLTRALKQGPRHCYASGVSLIAILRVEREARSRTGVVD